MAPERSANYTIEVKEIDAVNVKENLHDIKGNQ